MDVYKHVMLGHVKFQTSKGVLTGEQVTDLSINDLDTLAVSLDAEIAQSGKKSFVNKTTDEDKLAKLKFDFVYDVLTTKLRQREELSAAAERKTHNQKILALIADKQDESLKGKSIAELEALLQ